MSTFGDYSPTRTGLISDPTEDTICQRSGFKVKPETLVENWDGLWVRPQDAEPRHPQEYVRAKPETLRPNVSPEPDDQFLTDNQVQATDL